MAARTLTSITAVSVIAFAAIPGIADARISMQPYIERYEKEANMRKSEILKIHLNALMREERDMRMQKAAVRIMLEQAEKNDDDRKIEAFDKQIARIKENTDGIGKARKALILLMNDKKRYSELLMKEMARYNASHSTQRNNRRTQKVNHAKYNENYALRWPVIPLKGISAGFMDAGYKKQFGVDHYAIDIPTPQGSPVSAAADGKVIEVNDNDYGYNTISVKHESGVVTLYGHVSKILVAAGDNVHAGEMIALSGGRPGTRGSGLFTTGPHLHFETKIHGEAIDPLYFLPPEDIIVGAL